MSKRTKPPFRADQVGSLLRPQYLLDARGKFDKGEITAAQLRSIEDDAIRHAVKRQEEVGLKTVTDGEFRRRSWHMDFICRIGGVTSAGTQLRPFYNETGSVKNEIDLPKVVGKLALKEPIFAEDFEFLQSATKATPKLSIPSPSMLHGLGAIEDKSIYGQPRGVLGRSCQRLQRGTLGVEPHRLHLSADRRHDVCDVERPFFPEKA